VAMIQGVSPTPSLDKVGPLTALVVMGGFCGIVFIVDQFYAVDPLIDPNIFLKNKIFSVTTACGTCMALVRNSITYNFIFYLQGPMGLSPLGAGITLIPFGIGVMVAGFGSGVLSDKVRPGIIMAVGGILTLIPVIVFLYFDQNTSMAEIYGMLFFAGCGIGTFSSSNNMSMMLSVHKDQRGVASAVSMICLMFTSMLGIVLTFSFVLKSMTQAELFDLFIYGGSSLSHSTIERFLHALQIDWYIVIAACCLSIVISGFNDYVPEMNVSVTIKQSETTVQVENVDITHKNDSDDSNELKMIKDDIEMV